MSRAEQGMVSHVVLLKPRSTLSPAERETLMGTFERAVALIPGIREVRVGRRITHGAGYEAHMPETGEYLVILRFDDIEGLTAYLRHPAHAELGDRFADSLASALVYDFEDVWLESLRDQK